MNHLPVKTVLAASAPLSGITVRGWVRTRRDSKGFSFLEVNDGSCLASLQVVVDAGVPGSGDIEAMTTGASVAATGDLVASPGKNQAWELRAESVALVGRAPESYPLQKKGHTPEFLRSIAHLRPRSNLFGAVFRVRSRLAYAVHTFFQERGFFYVHTPVITTSDCEGAGEMFRVTTLAPRSAAPPSEDFFGKPAFLTVSGQLEGEAFACALTNIYTFGPTFRAENSHTARHAAEFWMIEPEMAFCDLQGDIDLAEENVRYLVDDTLTHSAADLAFFERFVDKSLTARLRAVLDQPFQRVSYSDAVAVLEKSGKAFEYPVAWGTNLQTEHERYLTEEHFRGPVTVYDYPRDIKPFYMRRNDDGRTAAAMDLLVPGIGEIVGGSQREERLDVLEENLAAHELPAGEYWWYTDLRRFGTVPHAGYGMGFERMLMFLTGVANIRDVIPFARTPGNAEF
jgi:asparaginyl-tRNA synthetase